MSKRNFCARAPKNWKLMWKPSLSCETSFRNYYLSVPMLIQSWPDHGRDCKTLDLCCKTHLFGASHYLSKTQLVRSEKKSFLRDFSQKTASWRCQNNPFKPFYARSPSNLQREVAKMKPEPSIPMWGRLEHGDMWWLRCALSKTLLLGWSLMRKVFSGCYTSMILVSNFKFSNLPIFWRLLYN